MKNKVFALIIGSGAGGLGAGCWLKHLHSDFLIIDGVDGLPKNLHNGVHYLHSIPELPFETNLKKILLTDGILEHGNIHSSPTLMHALKYSEKVREVQHPSSILNVGKYNSVYMPETNSTNQLIDDMYNYIGEENFAFGWWLKSIDVNNRIATFDKNGEIREVEYNHIVSTVPLNKMINYTLDHITSEVSELELKAAPVYITNFKVADIVPNWLINLYIPERYSSVYRASILNNICSVESMKPLDSRDLKNTRDMFFMFNLLDVAVEVYTWATGKVISLSSDDRKLVIKDFMSMNIHQIGRFGLWNRKLLINSTIKQAKLVVEFITDCGGNSKEDLEDLLSQ